MQVSAILKNSFQQNDITLSTDNNNKTIVIPSKPDGFGSSANGGELLMLAIATCFCNDIYREASRRNIRIQSVEVTATGNFDKEAHPGNDLIYEVKVLAPGHDEHEITDLILYVDQIAEIHNTIRKGTEVRIRMPEVL